MGKEYRAKTFKSGNSVALRLPKGLGIDQGVSMTLREEAGRYVFEPEAIAPKKIDLTGIAGTWPGAKLLESEDRLFDERELDWGQVKEA